VTLSDRDRRIILILIPIVVLVAYWFLLLSPKRSDLNDARDKQHQAEATRDTTVAQAAQLEKARQTFEADYAAVVRLGKAIPVFVDEPGVLLQLNKAANGTHIDFNSVTFGARAAATAPAAPAASTPQETPQGNAAPGGAPAQSLPGRSAEQAGNAVQQGNQASSNVNAASGGTTTGTTTSAQSAPPSSSSTATPASLDTVALTFNFQGTYFDLADFFHRLKRFVYVTNNNIFVRGRLLSIDTLTFAPGTTTTGAGTTGTNQLTATVGATIYLSPKSEGATGGATASGPAGTTTSTPSGTQTSSVPLATAGVR
jgi:hypothetical protein